MREVADAVEACRMSPKIPRWALQSGRTRARLNPHQRFCWNEERSRVYLIGRRQKHVTVITVIRPDTADTCAA